ncbi:MAG TPA: glycosyltransferase family 39 protein [Anaerolineae bacterium]|nr:glycosyltransferase family 39 protein [Anaerolineae bacterium]
MAKTVSKFIDQPRFPTIFLLVYALAYLVVRLINLTLMAAHYDELAILRRANDFVYQGHVTVGLDDSLKWFQLWLLAAFYFLPADTLWIGRFVSILAGLAGGLGSYVLAVTLFRQRIVGVLAALLYFITPFVFFYDRITMPDGLLTSLGIWIMILSVWAFERQPWRWAIIAGLVIGLASLTKVSGLGYLVVPLGALLLRPPGPSRPVWQTLAAIYTPALVGLATILISLNTQNLAVYTTKVSGESSLNWPLWLANSQTALSWVSSLMTLPIFGLGLIGLGLALLIRWRTGLYLLLVPVVFTAAFVAVSQTWYPRYLMPVIPSILVGAAWLLYLFYERLSTLKLGWATVVVAGLLLIPALRIDFWLLVDPTQAPLHAEERRQYIEGWPNTYRLAEAGDYLKSLAQEYPEIYLAVNVKSLIVQEGLKYYFDQPANVATVEFDPFSGHALDDLNEFALERPTFLILNSSRERGMENALENPDEFPQARKLTSFSKPAEQSSVEIYQWLSLPAMAEAWAIQSGVEQPLIVASHPQTGDSTGQARFALPSDDSLAEADFILIDRATLESDAFKGLAQSRNPGDWLALLPPDWGLTLYHSVMPWFLFRSERNAPAQYPLQSTLGQAIALQGFDLDRSSYRPGQEIRLTLHWTAQQDVTEDYMVFAQLIGADGRLYGQQDQPPLRPTGSWRSGQRLIDRYNIPLPADLPTGRYRLIAGLYKAGSGERLPARQPDQQLWPDNAIVLGEITVVSSDKP